jgi:hypothetical protein
MFNSGHGFSNVDTLSHIPVSSGIIFKEVCRMDWRRVCCQLRGINPLKGERNADPIARLSICPAAVAPVAGLYVYGGSDAGPGDGGEYLDLYGVQPGIAADHAGAGAGETGVATRPEL